MRRLPGYIVRLEVWPGDSNIVSDWGLMVDYDLALVEFLAPLSDYLLILILYCLN